MALPQKMVGFCDPASCLRGGSPRAVGHCQVAPEFGRIDPGLQTGLQLGIHLIPVASKRMDVTRDNARLFPVANCHFRSFFALVMRRHSTLCNLESPVAIAR